MAVLVPALAGDCRMPILLIIGAVSPPHTTVVNMTIERVVETYMSRCSPGMFNDCNEEKKRKET